MSVRTASGLTLVSAALSLMSCGDPVCLDVEAEPFAPGSSTANAEVVEALNAEWIGFHELVGSAPQLCVRRAIFGELPPLTRRRRGEHLDGYYDPINRTIRIVPTESPTRATDVLRHELCHVWANQVVDRDISEDVFFFDSELQSWAFLQESLADLSVNQVTEEAFAYSCGLGFDILAHQQASACPGIPDTLPAMEYLNSEVFRDGVRPSAPPLETVLSVRLPLDAEAISFESVWENVAGHLAVRVETTGQWEQIFAVEIETGEVRTSFSHVSDKPRLTPPALDNPQPPRGTVAVDSAQLATTAAGVFQLSAPMGTVDTLLVSEEPGQWVTPEGPCRLLDTTIPTFFFVGGSGTELWIAKLEGEILHVYRVPQ